MPRHPWSRLLSAALLATACAQTPGAYAQGPATSPTSAPAAHTFAVAGNEFLFDSKPYQIIAGDMHYARIPRAYWRDRLHKAKAMGLNTITTYVFWNLHEPRPGVFDFSGQNDIAAYLREAQAEGLNVILRPGPYVCAEWELGGYPSWLLKDRTVVLRSDEPHYTAAVNQWFARLGQEIQPLLLKNGGPIIAVQVENEYGSFGDDKTYLANVKQSLLANGMGDTVLYTSNGPDDLLKGSLPNLPTVVNFGTGDAEKSFAKLNQQRPDGPKMSGEYWAGWFDHWGEKHHETDGKKEAAELAWMLGKGYSVNVYMFHGGSTFGWMNGANSDGANYQPDTTSYDYDAPLDEAGNPRDKYLAFRDVIAQATGTKPPAPPNPTSAQAFPVAPVTLTASLWRNLPDPVESSKLLTMEDLDQSYGYVLYRTRLDKADGGQLILDGLHDYAQIYIDQQLIGTLDRRLGQTQLDLPKQTHASTLDILVENTGRVNFTKVIRTERKGLTGTVTIGGKQPTHWQIYSLPMDHLSNLRFTAEPCSGPCFYRTQLTVNQPADTYLDTRGLHKGMLWLGQQPLGRFWSIGPQYALYTPAPWLHNGSNPITFFDLQGDTTEALKSTITPIFGASISTRN